MSIGFIQCRTAELNYDAMDFVETDEEQVEHLELIMQYGIE